MQKFIEMGKLQFKTSIVYRLQFMSSIIILPLILIMYYFIWSSVYSNNPGDILGYSFNDMITYYVLSMVVSQLIFNMVGNKLQQKVIYGELTQDLLKPMPIFSQFLSREVADRSFAFVAEVIPVFVIAFILFNIRITSTFPFFLIGAILAFLLNFLIGFIMGLLAFWIQKIESIQWLMFIFVRFLSGEFIPLEFFGSTLFLASKFMPFYYLRYGVVQVFLGTFKGQDLAAFYLGQIFWIVVLYLLINVMWNKALTKFGAEGG